MTGRQIQDLLQPRLHWLRQNRRLSGMSERLGQLFANPPADWIAQAAGLLQAGPASLQKNNIWYHSRRDPLREADRQLSALEAEQKNHLVCIGAGLGYLPLLAAREKKFRSLLLIEPDPEIFFYLLLLHDWPALAGSDFHFHVIENMAAENLEDVMFFLQGKKMDLLGFYQHRPAFQALPGLYLPLQGLFSALVEKRSINQATLIKFQDLWNKNILLNSREILEGEKLSDFFGLAKGLTVVIAGAGPSLAESIADLKKYRSRMLLIAADTAFIPLARRGIVPDICLAVDPQWLNHFFIQHERVAESLWLLDPAVCHAIPHCLRLRGARLFFWDNPFYLDEIFRQQQGSRGEIMHGGSVSTNAFDLALKMQAAEIVLVGQDLSFPGKVAHVKGAALEHAVFYGCHRLKSMELHNYRQMTALPKLPVRALEAADNPGLFTNAKLKVFIDWFENQAAALAGPRLYNATARGAGLAGFERRSLSEIFAERPAINWKFPERPGSGATFKAEVRSTLSQYLAGLQKLAGYYRENLQLTEKILRQGGQKSQADLQKLADNDQKIQAAGELGKIVSLGAQNIILQITEGNDSNSPLQTSRQLYRELARSASQLGLWFEKALHSLKQHNDR